MRGEMKMSEIIINSEEEFNSIMSNGVCLVDFFATWCGPCKMLAPFIEEIAEEYTGKVNVCKVDVDKVESLAYRYNIRSIPTLMYIKNGEVKDIVVGFQDKKQISSKIEKLLEE